MKTLRAVARRGPVTLVYAAHDEVHNDAVALRMLLLGHRPSTGRGRIIDNAIEEREAYDRFGDDHAATTPTLSMAEDRITPEQLSAVAAGDSSQDVEGR